MEKVNSITNKIIQQETSTQQPTKILASPYDYEKVFEFLVKKGKQDFGGKFNILDADKAIIKKLVAYFLKDEFTCNENNIELQKGI